MRECAFCSISANLTAEHVISRWVSEGFRGEKLARLTDSRGQVREWASDELDWKARVVCRPCNNTWMSDIECQHAKPVMGPLIAGKINIPIRETEARSLALFAFKTAIVVDQTQRHREPFFSPRIRHSFRKNLDIPDNVRMWLCADAASSEGRFDVRGSYYSGKLSPTYPLQLNVLTCCLGFFAFQVLTAKHFGSEGFACPLDFEDLVVPFWPSVPPAFVWPPKRGIVSVEQFHRFADRWKTIGQIL